MDLTVEPVTQALGACQNCHYKVCFTLNLWKTGCDKEAGSISHTCTPQDPTKDDKCFDALPVDGWSKTGNQDKSKHCFYAPPDTDVHFLTKDGDDENPENEWTGQIDSVQVKCDNSGQNRCEGGSNSWKKERLWTVRTPLAPPTCNGPLPLPLAPSPSPEDCEMNDGGRLLTFYCPYENIIMEHCYKCFQPPDKEVIHCDGWSEQDIRDQCESAVPLPSPSPFPEGN